MKHESVDAHKDDRMKLFSLFKMREPKVHWPTAPHRKKFAVFARLADPQKRNLAAAFLLLVSAAVALFSLYGAKLRLERELQAARQEATVLRRQAEFYRKCLQVRDEKIEEMSKEQGKSFVEIFVLKRMIARLSEQLDEVDGIR